MALWISLYLHSPSPNPSLREASLQTLAHSLLAFTPDIALPEPGLLVMNIQASLGLFGGARALCRLVRKRAAAQWGTDTGYSMAMAPSARGAMVLATFAPGRQRRVIKAASLARVLNGLPLQVLPASQAFLGWLHSTGCFTLAGLRALPRGGLQQRTSALLVQQLDQAYGVSPLALSWFQPSYTYYTRQPLNYALEQAAGIFQAAVPVLQQACLWLNQHKLACHTIVLELHHETGRQACLPTLISVKRANPGWQPNDFLALLEQQLARCVLRQPVVQIALVIRQTQSRHAHAASLFPDQAEQRHQEEDTLDLIRARLGTQAVLQPHPAASFLPEQANQWLGLPLTPPCPPASGSVNTHPAVQSGLSCHSRPAWLFTPAIRLQTLKERPVYQGHVLHVLSGPERIETGWWMPQGHQQRDYFIAVSPNNLRYWVYRQRNTQGQHWYLQGQFG